MLHVARLSAVKRARAQPVRAVVGVGAASSVPGRRCWQPGRAVRGHLFVCRPHPRPGARVQPRPPGAALPSSRCPPPGDADRRLSVPSLTAAPAPPATAVSRPRALAASRGRTGGQRPPRHHRSAPRRGAGPAAALTAGAAPPYPGTEPPGPGGGSGPAAPQHTHAERPAPPPPHPPRRRLLTVRAVAGTGSGPACWLLPAGGARGGSGRYGGQPAAAGAMGRAGAGHVTGTSRGAPRGRGREPASRDRGTGRHGASPAVTWCEPAPSPAPSPLT